MVSSGTFSGGGEPAVPAHDLERATSARTPNSYLWLFWWLCAIPCICAQSSRRFTVHLLPMASCPITESRPQREALPGGQLCPQFTSSWLSLCDEAKGAIKSKGRQSLQNSDTRETGRDWPVMPTTQSGSFVAGSQQQSLAEFSLTVSSNEAQHILI